MTDQRQKITVFGAGSIGCYLGGQVCAGGAAVSFVGRSRYQKALTDKGLRLTHFSREDIYLPHTGFTFTCDAASAAPADCILVAVKSQDTETAGQALAKLAVEKRLGPESLIISMQNGIGNADILRKALPDNVVLGAVVPFNVTCPAPAHFHCGVGGDVTIEESNHPELKRLMAAFENIGQGCVSADDIEAVQWAKLLINLNNALNTLAGGPLVEGFADRDYRQAWALCMEEGASILAKAGHKHGQFGPLNIAQMIKMLRLPTWLYMAILKRRVTVDATARSSMQDDLDMGRAPEIDYLQGEIMRVAERIGHRAPYNAKIYALTQTAFEMGKSPRLSGRKILDALNA